MEYRDFNDYELLSFISERNEEAGEILYKKYQPLIHATATRMYNQTKGKIGIELSDLVQEGMVGLSFAIQNFNEKNGVLFYTYAKTCIERKILSAIIGAQRLKHKILNESVSINTEINGEEQAEIGIILSDNSMNPERLLIDSEEEEELQHLIYQELTDQERQILELRVNGFTYVEIAKLLEINKKKVDNVVQRIRAKLKKMTNKSKKEN
ncbi:MAG: sigma-70 family RNA polymerase sigma factor [Bacilli bacterium]|nr:sigma-70 family RNA polymerase sigma factor [Bacilli bacterium]